MPRKKKELVLVQPVGKPTSIKVRLDHRTVVTITPRMLEFWKQRYPKAHVIEGTE